jgi:hypothetical protein
MTVKFQLVTRNITAQFTDTAMVIHEEETESVTFNGNVNKLPEHINQLLMHVKFTPGGKRILKACLEKNMILKIGTDGSFFRGNETASIGWVLVGNQNVLAHGAGPVNGIQSLLSSMRAKLFGIAASNELLHHFMIFQEIKSTSKLVKCVNNRAAIAGVNQTQPKYSQQCQYSDDVDIITVIVDGIKHLTLQHRLCWVKAHQDDKKQYEELNIWGQLKIAMLTTWQRNFGNLWTLEM